MGCCPSKDELLCSFGLLQGQREGGRAVNTGAVVPAAEPIMPLTEEQAAKRAAQLKRTLTPDERLAKRAALPKHLKHGLAGC